MNNVSWLENAVFYNIYPQSFYDSNGDGIGDLNGIREKLSYVQDMGFTAIWLNPFYESPFRDAGYDVTNFYAVAPRYGTNEDFCALCREAHERGIKVVIDLVAGHTALECPWFQESCKPEKNQYTNRYIWTNHWGKTYKNRCIGGFAQRNGCYMHNFFYCQPALNYGFASIDDPSWQLPADHPDCLATKQELLNIMDYWIGLGADGFRVDMAASLIKNDPDGTGITAFWQSIRKIFDETYPQCVLISEWSHPSKAINAGFHIDFLIHFCLPCYTSLFREEDGRNVNPGTGKHSYFSTEGKGCLRTFLTDYRQQYEATKDKGYIAMPTGNHDLPRINVHRSARELEVAYAFLLTMPGVPFVYYGDEIGMPYAAELPSKEGGFNRTGSRTPMQWCRGKNAGFSNGRKKDLYLPVQENGVNVADQQKDENSLLNATKALICLRRNSNALSARGTVEFLNEEARDYPMVYRRRGTDGSYLIGINPTDREQFFPCPLDGAVVVRENDRAVIDRTGIRLPPISYAILKLNETEEQK